MTIPACPPPLLALSPWRRMAEQAFSRAAGAPLIGGNDVDLLIDAAVHFDAWEASIGRAQKNVFLENYIIRNDAVGRRIRDALVARAQDGVTVCVVRDWMGCLGSDGGGFWQPLLAAGGEVRSYNPPRLDSLLGWISRDHRKLLVIDNAEAYITGVCLSEKWLGDAKKKMPPWRDTGVRLRGPAVAELVHAFAELWSQLGKPLAAELLQSSGAEAGQVDVRVIATQPSTAGLFRLDQLICAMARQRLWLADAYFVGLPPYVQALSAASRDGVDVRLLVPGTSDIPAVARMSQAGYRPLLEAGIRVFEWNGSMMHAKTAVADSRWARVGSSNLNIASWMGNCEIDLAVEDRDFAAQMEQQYLADLDNATEIVLKKRKVHKIAEAGGRHAGGSSSRAAAGMMRIAHSVGAALGNQRVLGQAEATSLPWIALSLLALTALGLRWPVLLAWPAALVAGFVGISLLCRYVHSRRRNHAGSKK
ncbi:cardiolipin synthase [Tahibacter aquaticus]|uniref:Cardiolipin synthase n=1 Tax=Tahibacter aquaticus TaxID=520092 RepID=A0A4R6YRM1_9GAMM|nr:phospholipase D-like domain-containing protein [Tahibacter aquaticus]TDR40767.1 cardiolipin synthase [Tahibacter aquaticus]